MSLRQSSLLFTGPDWAKYAIHALADINMAKKEEKNRIAFNSIADYLHKMHIHSSYHSIFPNNIS